MKRALFLLLFLISFGWASEIKILGIGSPCVDYIVKVEENFFLETQTAKGVLHELDWENFTQILAFQPPFLNLTGGSCANTIKGLASLNEKTALFGKIGCDELGSFVVNSFISLGIAPLFLLSSNPTSQIACLITPDGERTFITHLSAEKDLSEEELYPELFEGVELVHIEGYLLRNPDFVKKAFHLAKSAGALLSFDLSHPNIVEKHRELLLELIPVYVDLLFANEEEAHALTHLPPRSACETLKEICSVAVVKVGEKGCWVGSDTILFHTPAISVHAIDTTGAGDLFAAGFIHGYIEGKSLETCAFFGNLLGSSVVQVYGAEIPKKEWIQLKKIISESD